MDKYIIMTTVHGFFYYWGDNRWEGLINNAQIMDGDTAKRIARKMPNQAIVKIIK
jgi:hypothetical protein